MNSRRAALLALLAAPPLLGGCSFSYSNPAEVLGTGEVAGRVVADAGGTGTTAPVAGVRVEVRNSYNSATSRDTGRFFVFGLMPGRHTLLLSKAPDLALQRDVEMAWGADGQPEGVVLGDVTLRRAVTLKGKSLAPPLPFGTSFAPTEFAVTDEETGQQGVVTPDLTPGLEGAFDFTLPGAPVGRHRLRLGVAGLIDGLYPVSFVAGPLVLDVPATSEGLQLAVTDVVPSYPAGPTGKLRFKVAVAGASYAGPYDISVVPLPVGSGTPQVPTPDSTGTCEVDLSPGVYQVNVGLPVGTGSTLLGPPIGKAVVVESQTSELGTFYLVDSSVISQSSQACFTGADCAGGASCTGGRCVTAACLPGNFATECANWLSACASGSQTPCAGGKGYCTGSSVDPVCIPLGASLCQAAAGGTWSLSTCRVN